MFAFVWRLKNEQIRIDLTFLEVIVVVQSVDITITISNVTIKLTRSHTQKFPF